MPMMKALLLSSGVLLSTCLGCATTPGGVALRPDGTPGPEECPVKALEVMGYLKMHVGDATWVELDANQVGAKPITLYDGPIESVLQNELGTLETATRLYGRVWTGGPRVVIRYYEAHPPDGSGKVPICAVARLGEGQLRKRPESKPGMAILEFPIAAAYIVESFR
jgi:hypothetical protein